MWQPDPQRPTRISDFMEFCSRRSGQPLATYQDLWKWSVSELSDFWDAVRVYFDVIGDGFSAPALATEQMPGAVWYPGATLNYAENLLRPAQDPQRAGETAIIDITEDNIVTPISWSQLSGWTASLARKLRELGVEKGDRVAAVLPNAPEALVGLLATASIGATWALSSPDLSAEAIVNRFVQLEPKVLIGSSGYQFNGKHFDRGAHLERLTEGLPSLQHVLIQGPPGIDEPNASGAEPPVVGVSPFPGLPSMPEIPDYVRLPFDHPLWVLFSSGTSGSPKGIVHGHGGMVLESLKGTALNQDMGPDDVYYVAANTSWMVWNTLASNLMSGAAVVTYAGSPSFGGPARQFEIIERTGATMFGVGAAYLSLVEKSGIRPGKERDLSRLRSILSTGSPLPASTWRWVHEHVKPDVHLGSDSGGTDICSGFVGSNPITPVHLGEAQGPLLGVCVQAWDTDGTPMRNAVGEMVITRPMPSMPLFLWNDAAGKRYQESYFSVFPGVWSQGDWISETSRRGFVVHGRSDATLNRMGVRLGSADIYGALQDIPEIRDCIVLGIELPNGGYWMPLFVAADTGRGFDEELADIISATIRTRASARHVPDEIIACPDIPVTHAGKRIEIPLKRLFMGNPVDLDALRGSLANPRALDWFIEAARTSRSARSGGR